MLIAAAVFATQKQTFDSNGPPSDTTRVVLFAEARPDTPEHRPKSVESPLRSMALVVVPPLPKGFQTITAPIDVPVDIPPIDLAERFDPRDFSGIGAEGGVWDGWEGGSSDPDGFGNQPVPAGIVDEPPRVISSPKLRFPETLRAAGLEGVVLVSFVVDTTGRAEPESIAIVASTHPAFEASAKEVIRKSRYRPGRMRGKPVRTLATRRVEFRFLGGGRT